MLQKLTEDRKLLGRKLFMQPSYEFSTVSNPTCYSSFCNTTPFFARAKAVFLPNPRLAPVTNAIFILSFVIVVFLVVEID